jgi:hypothetical protein
VAITAVTKSSRTTNHIGRTDGRPFPLPSTVGLPLLSRYHPRTCDNIRKPATECDFDHRDLIAVVGCTNRLPEWGTSADRSTTPWARDERFCEMSAGELRSDEMPAERVANSEELAQANDLATAPIRTLVRARLIIGASVATYACVSSGSGRPVAR